MNTLFDIRQDNHDFSLEDNLERFEHYNNQKLENLLKRFSFNNHNLFDSLPLLFHVNQNLLPGYVNNRTPDSICHYSPDTAAIHFAKSFNSRFEYNDSNLPASHNIEAIYLQDNLRTGKIILWVVHVSGLSASDISLLKEKTAAITKWLESRSMHLDWKVSSAGTMPLDYWNNRYGSMHPDKSIFLDEFYSECIYLAGKLPAWWLVHPELETDYEGILSELPNINPDLSNSIIDFGPVTSTRPQDYLAYLIISILNIRSCPESTWLGIIDLCHKISEYPKLNCTSIRMKEKVYSSGCCPAESHEINRDLLIKMMNRIYRKDQLTTLVSVINSIARYYDNKNSSSLIYKSLLSCFDTNYSVSNNSNPHIKYAITTETIYELTRIAIQWFINRIISIDEGLLKPDGEIHSIIYRLLNHITPTDGRITVTNSKPNEKSSDYDFCLQHNVAKHVDNWSLIAIDNKHNEHSLRTTSTPEDLVAWGVFNKLINQNSRISISCPALSIKQTDISSLCNILMKHVSDIDEQYYSLDYYTCDEIPLKDIVILHNDIHTDINKKDCLLVYRFQITSHGNIKHHKRPGVSGFITLICDTLSTDRDCRKISHSIDLYSMNNRYSKSFLDQLKNAYTSIYQFSREEKCNYTHYIDIINNNFYAIEKYNNRLITYCDLDNNRPEEHLIYNNKHVLMKFSNNVENCTILNYLYRQNKYDYLQVFYYINDDTSDVYILDENGRLTRFTQPFHDKQSFINQWLMFLHNTRNRIGLHSPEKHAIPGIEICEISRNYRNTLMLTHLNSSIMPDDKQYYDIKITINQHNNINTVKLSCANTEFSSIEYGNNIYIELRNFLQRKHQKDIKYPVYISDIDASLAIHKTNKSGKLVMSDYIIYKRNIEKRINSIINN